jgi:hypothetical protein
MDRTTLDLIADRVEARATRRDWPDAGHELSPAQDASAPQIIERPGV